MDFTCKIAQMVKERVFKENKKEFTKEELMKADDESIFTDPALDEYFEYAVDICSKSELVDQAVNFINTI